MSKITSRGLILIAYYFCFSNALKAQTDGTLTFTFTQVAHSPGYSGTKNVLAVWIQDNNGGFVKTKRRNVGNSTKDHLPTWSVNAGVSASNALGSACNVTDATTGATLTSFTTRTITWDGKNVNGTANGTTVPDGVYRVAIQETWNHGTAGTTIRYYTFTKGPNADHQTPANDADFSNMTLDWVPGATAIVEMEPTLEGVEIFPNPSNDGLIQVKYEKAKSIQIVNLLGDVLFTETLENGSGIKTIDLNSYANGIYFITVSYNANSVRKKVLLNK